MVTRLLATSLAALLFLAGCSGDGADTDTAATSGTTASEETASESASAPTADEDSSVPDGQQQVTATKSGVQFLVPEDWQVLGAEALENPGSQAALEGFAEQAGIPAQQLQQMAAQVDVLAIAPDGGENINVLPPTALPAMPSAARIKMDFERLGATVSGVEETETPIGPGRTASYTLPPVQGVEQSGASLFVETDRGVVNLTATTRSATRAPELLDEVVTTLERAD